MNQFEIFAMLAELALETRVVRVLKANEISTMFITRWLLTLAMTAESMAVVDAASFGPNWN